MLETIKNHSVFKKLLCLMVAIALTTGMTNISAYADVERDLPDSSSDYTTETIDGGTLDENNTEIPLGYALNDTTNDDEGDSPDVTPEGDLLSGEKVPNAPESGTTDSDELAFEGDGSLDEGISENEEDEELEGISEDERAIKAIVSFNLNGGSGTVPAALFTDSDGTVVLPSENGSFSKPNHTLIGWSEVQDANLVIDGVGMASIYEPGSLFETDKDVTLFAAWARTSGQLAGKLVVALRQDGTIPGEPSIQYADYSYIATNYSVKNILDYFTPAHTTSSYKNVKSMLQPAFYSYVDSKNVNNKYWNPETQYVEWYVIKYQENDYKWHIDGVVRDIHKYNLYYNGNGSTGGLLPDGFQEQLEGEQITVAQPGNYYNAGDWRPLVRSGYEFVGWNTEPDGGGKAYAPGASMTLDGHTTLYAQWKLKSDVSIKYVAMKGGSVDLEIEYLNPETGTPSGSTATADGGFEFVGWFLDKDCSEEGLLSTEPTWIPSKEADETWAEGMTYYAKFAPKYRDIWISGHDEMYDGEFHGVTFDADLLYGDTVYYKVEGGEWTTEPPLFKNAQESTAVYVKIANPDYQDAYGTVTIAISKRQLTLVSQDASKEYDGTPLTNDEIRVEGDGFVGEEGAICTITGTITEAGTAENAFIYELKSNTNADNYVIGTRFGILEVTEAPSQPPAEEEHPEYVPEEDPSSSDEPESGTPSQTVPSPVPGTVPGAATTPAAPFVPATPAAPATTAPVPAEAPAIVEVTGEFAPAGEAVIGDNENPLAELREAIGEPEIQIDDDANPLAGFDKPYCWVHYWIAIGLALTTAYTVIVVIRRMAKNNDDDDSTQKSHSANTDSYPTAAI